MQPYMILFTAVCWLFTVASSRAAPLPRNAEIEVSGPFSTGINCPTVYSWTGGNSPFTATFYNIDTGGISVPFDSYINLAGSSFTWLPQNNATGQMFRLSINDDEGDEGSMQIIIVSTQTVC